MTTKPEQLSIDVAKLEGIDPSRYTESISDGQIVGYTSWLHEDSARCFDIMCNRKLVPDYTALNQSHPGMQIRYGGGYVTVGLDDDFNRTELQSATRVAILRARLAMG